LLQFCAALIRRLTRAEKQYAQGRDAFNALAERYYGSRTPEQQQFLRRASLLDRIDGQTAERFVQLGGAKSCLEDLQTSEFSLVQSVEDGKVELHPFFRDFLQEKLLAGEGQEAVLKLHSQIATQYETLGDWERAVDHSLKAQDWPRASRLLVSRRGQLNDGLAKYAITAIARFPGDYFLATPAIVHLKAEALTMLGDLTGAVETYKNVLSRKPAHGVNAEAVARYRSMAEALADEGEIAQALQCLRSALNLTEKENAADSGELSEGYRAERRLSAPLLPPAVARTTGLAGFVGRLSRSLRGLSFGRWFGGILGLTVWLYLWFWTPDIGLNPAATKQLGLLSLTLIYWVFWVFPDYGVALIFALGLILTGLGKAEVVLSGFASTSWFMTLGVLGLGAAITSSGLFYRLSLRLVRIFPLNYSWQIIALGFMGIVVMALIPQQSARTAIISQMLVNLSESLGYKNPSKASTGMFVASFLGLGHLGFLFLTGSTTSLIAWGLLSADVRAKFTWGYWFLAALPPTLVVVAIILGGTLLLYRPESRAQVSYRMVENRSAFSARYRRMNGSPLSSSAARSSAG
jgi:tetratricopeptide (TPR) repeat protein